MKELARAVVFCTCLVLTFEHAPHLAAFAIGLAGSVFAAFMIAGTK